MAIKARLQQTVDLPVGIIATTVFNSRFFWFF